MKEVKGPALSQKTRQERGTLGNEMRERVGQPPLTMKIRCRRFGESRPSLRDRAVTRGDHSWTVVNRLISAPCGDDDKGRAAGVYVVRTPTHSQRARMCGAPGRCLQRTQTQGLIG
jgi:hypothetical protein